MLSGVQTVTTARAPLNPEVDSVCRQFFLWALSALKLDVEDDENGTFRFAVPPERETDFGGRQIVRFTFAPVDSGQTTELSRLSLYSSLGLQIFGLLQRVGGIVHAVPSGQPVSVSDLTARLFDAYTVENGNVRLGGCSMEDRPLLRYTYIIRSESDAAAARLTHVYASPDGRPIDDSLLSALGAREIEPLGGRPARVQEERQAQWLEFGRNHAPVVADGEQADFLVATVVWCKYALGKLLFAIGDTTAETEFHGWARLLADGTISPPPFQCPETGRQSYHLVTVDDGRITVPQSVAVCEQSGRRALTSDLITCSITGRHVLPELIGTCPVSGDRLLPSAMVSCGQCLQAVSPHCIRGGRCLACRSLQPVRRDDARIARVLGEYERLDHWPRWQIAETATCYVLIASAWVQRLLVVLDKETLAVARVAEGTRFSGNWSEVTKEQRQEYVG